MIRISGRELTEMGRDITTPFLLSILPETNSTTETANDQASSKADIEISRLIRLLPGKRLVAVGQWEGQAVIAKLFFQNGHWKRHLERERAGTQLIQKAEILSPRALLFARMAGDDGGVMINEYLAESQGAGDLLETSQFKSQFLTAKILDLIISCYDKGLWQNDIHLNNFLIYRDQVYLIDGADVKAEAEGGPVPEINRLKNLALFFAQFPVWHDQELETLMANVNHQGSAYKKSQSSSELAELVTEARNGRIDAYSKKLTRSSTAHFFQHRSDRFVVCDRAILSNEFNDFIDNPNRYIDQGEMVKAGNTSTVVIVTIQQNRYLLKRYNVKSLSHDFRRILGRLLGHNRALNSWRFALILSLLGINTAKPLMMLERRAFRWIPRESYFLCEVIEGNTVAEIIEDESFDSSKKSTVISAFRGLFSAMAECRISHGDLKATNFIFTKGKLYVLDLDAMKRHKDKKSFRKSFQKDINRFINNWAGKKEFESITQQAVEATKSFSN